LSCRQVIEIEHGEAVDDAGLVEQCDLESRLGEIRAERVVDDEGQPAAFFRRLRGVELEAQYRTLGRT
jgi:hypothetical protein